ncbi:hypothetical protein GQ42DRAFT_156435 [Ramicandelaber brevisporus]|nr:hypothetical protein GQ42DRAFT_156435 [Ramicandelaber brevisporus]
MQPQIKRARLDSAAVAAVCQLFRLPRELLELVAAYFSRGEAVPVLAVNSALHEIFAERVWRRLDTDLISSMTAPLESLAIYGHLVRHLRITESIPESIDLATMFPNITHLWIPFIELADTIKSSQGKCFERLSWLSTWAVAFHYHALKVSDSIGSVLNWLDSRFKAEAGLEKVEWKLYDRCEMQLQHKILKWFQHNDQLSRIQFKFIGEPLDFNDAKHADLNKIIAHRLVDWKIDDNDDQCAAERFSRVLDSIPLAERQHFQFSALKRLEIGTCCEVGDDVYLQFNFGVLFPFVQELSLDTTIDYCQDYSEDAFGAILAHPWPSVRRLDLYGEFSFNSTVSHLVAVPNVEELSMILDDDSDYEEMGIVDLCELDRTLPKLVRLQVTRFTMVSDSISSVLNWLDSRFKAEAGLEKVEWKLYDRCEMQLQHKILKWFQHNDQLSRIQFKFIGEPLDFNDAKHADLNKIIAHRLVDWKIDDNDDQCAAERFSRVLDSIPLAERQHFQFSALKRLEIGTCCEVGDDVYLQFNFGVLFPFVQELSLDTTIDYCQDYSEDAFGAILAHPWPSVRRLDLYGEFSFNSTVSHLVAVPNVEELSMILDDDSDYEEMGIVDLCELDRTLPKLVRLQVTRFTTVSAPQQHSQKQHSQQHQLFRHLRYVSFGRLAMTSSAISALVHAPVLTDICMEYVIFENGGDVGISDEDEDEDEDGSIHRMDSARSLDFLSGVANTTVRFVDIYVGSEHVSTKYEDTLSAMLKCFVRLGVCTIQSNDREAVPGLRKEFASVKFKYLNWL